MVIDERKIKAMEAQDLEHKLSDVSEGWFKKHRSAIILIGVMTTLGLIRGCERWTEERDKRLYNPQRQRVSYSEPKINSAIYYLPNSNYKN